MNEQLTEDYLSAQPFFTGLDSSYIKFLSDSATELLINKDDVLFRQGERADKFYVVRGGQLSFYVPALIGAALEIQILTKDQIVGWSWLIAPYRWAFQARAVEDTQLLAFDGSAILQRCEKDPLFGYELLKRFAALMSGRLDSARQKMMDQWDPPGFA